MSGIADIDLPGITLRLFQCNLHRSSGICHGLCADHNVVSMSAPAFGISGQHNGKHFCVRLFYRIVYRRDLTGCTGSGTDDSHTAVILFYFHFLPELRVYTGNDKSNGVKHGSSHKLRHGILFHLFTILRFTDCNDSFIILS